MISRSKLLASLEISVGPKIMKLISENMIDNVLNVKVLPRFSQWYPKIYDVRIHIEDAIPFRDYSGKIHFIVVEFERKLRFSDVLKNFSLKNVSR